MRLCKFTNSYGRPVYVNPALVRLVERDPAFDETTQIQFASDHSVHVQEKLDAVIAALADDGQAPG